MQSKRKRILAMLENGTITTEEALTLLENLGESQVDNNENASELKIEKPQITFEKESEKQSTKNEEKRSASEPTQNGEPSMDEFLEDLRKDFTHVGDRFMQFMQSAVQKGERV